MRRGEVLGLRWRDLRLDENRLSVSQALSAPGREIRASEPKTRRARRSIALDPATVDALHEQHARQAAERGLLGAKYHDRDLVFAESDGAPIHPDSLSNLFAARVKASALPVIRLHDLRSTHATLALQAGVHPKVVSERLGHASVAFTLDVYSHAIRHSRSPQRSSSRTSFSSRPERIKVAHPEPGLHSVCGSLA